MTKNDNINNWLKCYLIGAMQDAQDKNCGREWRTKIKLALNKLYDTNHNQIYIFDPTLEEERKIGMSTEEFHTKLSGWLVSGKHDLIKEYSDLIWKGKTYLEKDGTGSAKLVHIFGDFDYVKNSNFLIAKIEKGDKPVGTYFEAGLAFHLNIPVYVLQTMNLTDYAGSFIHAVFGSGGGFFESENKLIEFLKAKHGLTEHIGGGEG